MCGEGFICRFSSDFCKSTLPPLVLSVAYPASPAGHSPLAANCLPNFPWPPIHPWLHVRVQLTALVAGALYIATLQRKRWQGALALRNRNQPYIYMHPTFPILVLYWHHSSAFASTVPDHVSAPVHPTSSCDQSEKKRSQA